MSNEARPPELSAMQERLEQFNRFTGNRYKKSPLDNYVDIFFGELERDQFGNPITNRIRSERLISQETASVLQADIQRVSNAVIARGHNMTGHPQYVFKDRDHEEHALDRLWGQVGNIHVECDLFPEVYGANGVKLFMEVLEDDTKIDFTVFTSRIDFVVAFPKADTDPKTNSDITKGHDLYLAFGRSFEELTEEEYFVIDTYLQRFHRGYRAPVSQ